MASLTPAEKAIREDQLAFAIAHLIEARNFLKRAGATRSAEKVRRALKSAGGAKRNAEGQATRIRLPMCVAVMHCLCAGHARGAAVDAACDATE